MSVYTPQQVGQPYMQPPAQAPIVQQPYGQQPWGQFGQQSLIQQHLVQQHLPSLVSEVSLRCAATAVAAVAEQLRMDPQTLIAAQTHGQIPPHVWGATLAECARRIAPVVHATLVQIAGQGPAGGHGQYGPLGSFGSFGQIPGLFPLGQAGQFPVGLNPLGLNPQFGPVPPLGV